MSSIPGIGSFPWRRAWQSFPVFFSGELHGQRSLAGYSPWGHKESDMAKFSSVPSLIQKTIMIAALSRFLILKGPVSISESINVILSISNSSKHV